MPFSLDIDAFLKMGRNHLNSGTSQMTTASNGVWHIGLRVGNTPCAFGARGAKFGDAGARKHRFLEEEFLGEVNFTEVQAIATLRTMSAEARLSSTGGGKHCMWEAGSPVSLHMTVRPT